MSTALIPSIAEPGVQPFVDGERMDAEEFMRRYELMPDLQGAQLIEGVVYMPSPIMVEDHGEPQGNLIVWSGIYRIATPGTRSAAPGTVELDWRNDPEPDGLLWIDEKFGGQGRVNERGYFAGAPELIMEVSNTTKACDLGPKRTAYERNQVQEYLVWLVPEGELRWHRLRGGRFELLQPDADGILRSEVFPGLWLDGPALLRGEMATVLAVLQQGISSPEHANFVVKLQRKRN